jgi:hypothetical protein
MLEASNDHSGKRNPDKGEKVFDVTEGDFS